MKTIKDFKNKMKVGSHWIFCASEYCETYTKRTCTISQSNSFALESIRDPSKSSWSDWPTSKEVVFLVNFKDTGETAVKIKIPKSEYGAIHDEFLVYIPLTENTKHLIGQKMFNEINQ